MKFLVIAFAGKAQSGKSTAKQLIQEIVHERYHDEYRVVPISFATKLKDIAYELFGWDGEKGLHYKGSELVGDLGRQLLINIGQKMREIRSTVWCDFACRQIDKEILNGSALNSIYIIDDLRFKTELQSVRKYGSKLVTVKIIRDTAVEIDDISEKDLNDVQSWDHVLINNGTLEDYKGNLKELLRFVVETTLRASKVSA